ncbi:DUF6597 domain-containing transcriptional factor [Amycolatopsis sp. NPDC001319]|uniref:DUF6597 domain-containing transcriptional factor n=1 Tax=unclassified Amycolatopsis TaxID=2618356 RepID=UPI0036CC6677
MRRIPRGIVDEHVARTKFTLARHAPAPALAEFVDYHWVLHWDLDGFHDQHVLPNVAVHVTFFPGACGVYGPGHTLFTHRLEGRAHGLGVRFRPGCFRPFLGAPCGSSRTDPCRWRTSSAAGRKRPNRCEMRVAIRK